MLAGYRAARPRSKFWRWASGGCRAIPHHDARARSDSRTSADVSAYTERRLRVVALGRKNYLFVGHARAGRNIAGLYSLVGSCIANGVEPTEYLIDVLPRIAGANSDEALDALLPDRWTPTRPAP